jgi:hypothetical protein
MSSFDVSALLQVFSLRPRFSVAAARARNEKVAEEHEHWDDDEDTAKVSTPPLVAYICHTNVT